MAKLGDSIPAEFIISRQLDEFKSRNTLPGVSAGQGRYDWTRARRTARRKARKSGK